MNVEIKFTILYQKKSNLGLLWHFRNRCAMLDDVHEVCVDTDVEA